MSENLGNTVDPSLPSGSNHGIGGEARVNNDLVSNDQIDGNHNGVNDRDRNGNAKEEGNNGYELTDTQKGVLLARGFDRHALDKMRFPSYKEAYDWCGEQMRSPRKRRFSDGGETSDPTPPRKRIPLTDKQKWLLSSCGRSRRELDEMRFDSVDEGYRWVGDVARAYLMPCEYDPYDYEEEGNDDFDDYYEPEDPDTEESFSSENESYMDSEGRTVSLEDDSDEAEEQNSDKVVVPATTGKLVDLTDEEGTSTQLDRLVAKHASAVEQPVCGICFEPMGRNTNRHMAAGKCGHVYCRECLEHTVGMQRKCPACNKRMGVRSIRNIYLDS
jgi:hypothetical protein